MNKKESKMINLWVDEMLFEYIKLYCNSSKPRIKIKEITPEILYLGWVAYKEKYNIEV